MSRLDIPQLLAIGEQSFRSGNHAAARSIFEQILATQPRHSRASECLAYILGRAGQGQAAQRLLEVACEDPDCSAEALYYLGASYLHQDRAPLAIPCFERALRKAGDFFEGLHELGTAQSRVGDFAGALSSYQQAARLNPKSFQAHFNLGRMHDELRQFAAAADSYGRAIALQPDFAPAWSNRGIARSELQQHTQALADHEQATRLDPGDPEAWTNQAVTLGHLGRHQEALACYDRALQIRPDDARAWSNRGVTLDALRRHGEALACHARATQAAPDDAQAWANQALALHHLGRHEEALSQLDRALSLAPGLARAWADQGIVQAHVKRYEQALASYDRALQLRPDDAETLTNKGVALSMLGRRAEGLALFEQALAIRPELDYLLGQAVNAQISMCQWNGLAARLDDLAARIRAGARAIAPFPALAVFDVPELGLRAAATWARDKHPVAAMHPVAGQKQRADRIVVGYYSADFHDHATSYLMAEFFERHDRRRFELVAFSFGPDVDDASRRRLVATFDRFLDVRSDSDEAIARRSRELGVDIAVDLKGFTLDGRPGIFAQRAAPIQVSYLGYPGSTGADFMDYVLADAVVVPEGDEPFYSEKIVRLPFSYQVTDTRRAVSPSPPSRREAGLPEQGIVLCCFNNNYKITPETFDSWTRILRRVEGSVLWLLAADAAAVANLRREAVARGIAAERLVFAKFAPLADHLARYRLADLFLDTLPYNAHTTGSDALWCGVPVVTLQGRAFAGRVAASLLHAVGLQELVTHSRQDYENLAVALASDPVRLGELRRRLEAERQTAPLFDTARSTRAIEAAYEEMVRRHRAGLPPEHLRIPAS
ncbi:MAG TPA: tetratricopeptide repeat protein [Ramlibacter sp.]|jgi:predicted O-linked N-acetylglucosamine transferase (SPINDLY family)|uniref:tetratricopeptide repeat protein n=1 Tax=Ramlibacter sp. TaxID=1917967 RepID=UPI002D450231|nr:tetratricopeptide repeat protein [Ramlibacter sp.]HZY18587.1 tetratricopeptide repeat protein [Ramlibacter sp.]